MQVFLLCVAPKGFIGLQGRCGLGYILNHVLLGLDEAVEVFTTFP